MMLFDAEIKYGILNSTAYGLFRLDSQWSETICWLVSKAWKNPGGGRSRSADGTYNSSPLPALFCLDLAIALFDIVHLYEMLVNAC